MKSFIVNKKYSIFLCLGAGIISFSGVFVKWVQVEAEASAFYRVLLGGLFLLLINICRKEKIKFDYRAFLFYSLSAFFFALDLTLWHKSILFIGPGLSTLLANFQVFFLAGIGIIFFKEKLSLTLILAIPLAILGILLLFGFNWGILTENYQLGLVFGLLTAVCYTGYILSLRYLQIKEKKNSPVIIMWVSFLTAFFVFIFMKFSKVDFQINSSQDFFILLLYGCFSQAIGWLLITSSLPHIPASRVGLILLLQPSLAIIWDVLFFKRGFTWVEAAGFLITLLAIYFGSIKKNQNNSHKIKTSGLQK